MMDAIVYASPTNRSTPADACGEAAANAACPQALKNEPAAKIDRLLRPRLWTALPKAPLTTGAMNRPNTVANAIKYASATKWIKRANPRSCLATSRCAVAVSRSPGARPPSLVTISAAPATVTALSVNSHGAGRGKPSRHRTADTRPSVNTSCQAIGLKNQPPGSGQFGRLRPNVRAAP